MSIMRQTGVVAAISLALSLPCFAQATHGAASARTDANFSAAIKNISNAVVQVRAQAGKLGYAGTGFIVDRNYVITNCHVVGLCRENPLLTDPKVTVYFRIPGIHVQGFSMTESFRGIPAKIIDSDFENDLTLLQLPTDFEDEMSGTVVLGGGPQLSVFGPAVSEADLSSDDPKEGTIVLISGYPFMEPFLVSQRGMIAGHALRSDIEDTASYVSDSDLWFVDAMINEGNSGAPVYVPSSSKVIGVAEGFRNAPGHIQTNEVPPRRMPLTAFSNSGLSFVIPAKYVLALLQKNHVVPAPK